MALMNHVRCYATGRAGNIFVSWLRGFRKKYVGAAVLNGYPMTDNEELPFVTDDLGDEPSDVTGTVEQAPAAPLDGIAASDLTPTSCRFPLWPSNARVSHRYCGKSIESATGAYCPEHRTICFNLSAGRGRSTPSPTQR